MNSKNREMVLIWKFNESIGFFPGQCTFCPQMFVARNELITLKASPECVKLKRAQMCIHVQHPTTCLFM